MLTTPTGDDSGAFAVAAAPVDMRNHLSEHEARVAAAQDAVGLARGTIEELDPGAIESKRSPESKRSYERDADDEHDAADEVIVRRHRELLWLMAAPGQEESALEGIHDSGLPDGCVLLGATAADQSLAGRWWQLAISPDSHAASGAFRSGSGNGEGIVVVHFRPSIDFTPVFDHGFAPTVHRATVTEHGENERVLKRLCLPDADGSVPAAELYNRWTGGWFDEELRAAREGGCDVNILAKSTSFPLGIAGASTAVPSVARERSLSSPLISVGETHEFDCTPYVTLHPAFIHPDGSLSVFAHAPVGAQVCARPPRARGAVHSA